MQVVLLIATLALAGQCWPHYTAEPLMHAADVLMDASVWLRLSDARMYGQHVFADEPEVVRERSGRGGC